MPELPEVEIVCRQLRKTLVGATILGGKSMHKCFVQKYVSGGDAPPLPRGTINRLWRHGKWIFFSISDRLGRQRFVRVNLGMSGRFVVVGVGEEQRFKKQHVRWRSRLIIGGRDAWLVYLDPRCMGRLQALPPFAGTIASKSTAKSDGVEALGLGPDWLSPLMRSGPDYKRVSVISRVMQTPVSVKRALMDQSRLAGLGNIYASEACWLAGIHPDTPARSVRGSAWVRMLRFVPAMLEKSIASGGTSLGDANSYKDSSGREGSNLIHLAVYGRAGQPCKRCNGTIQKTTMGGRSTYFCEKCQGKSDASTQANRSGKDVDGGVRKTRSRKRHDRPGAAAKPKRGVRVGKVSVERVGRDDRRAASSKAASRRVSRKGGLRSGREERRAVRKG